MKWKRIIALTALAVMLPFGSLAKRGPAPKVPPIEIAGIEYRAPNEVETEGCIEAWDTKSQTLLWRKKVYHTFKIPFAEEDNQWTFIKSMTVGKSGDELIIVNEAGRQFTVKTTPPSVLPKIGAALLGLVLVYFVFLFWSKRGGGRRSSNQN